MTRKVIGTDQIGGDFAISYFAIEGATDFGADHGHKVEEIGKLAALSAKYKAYCDRVTTMRHGPAILTLAGEKEGVGFVNALGHVYLNQELHRRIL